MSISAEREARYTWGGDDGGMQVVSEGDGEALDLEALVADAAVSSNTAKANDEDGPGSVRYIHGLECVIETPKGGTRRGPGWSQVLPYDYGYIRGVEGADGDSMDVAIGPQSNGWVYLIDQFVLGTKDFDETKCFINWPSANAALNAFHAGHHRSKEVMLDWTPTPIEEFKRWLKDGDHSKPAGGKP